jgi:UDP-N-acetylglucosamine 2-epimerase
MKTILCVAYGGGHITQIIPVIRELQKNPNINIKIIALTIAAKKLQKENIPYQSFKDFISKDDHEILTYGKELAKNIHRDNSGIPYEETIAYLGASFFDLVKTHGEEEAYKIYENHGRKTFLPITIMTRIFAQIKPDFVITTNVARAEKAARIVALENNIPVLAMQDLPILITDSKNDDNNFFEPIHANYINVISNHTKLALEEIGYLAKDKFIICGNPAFDRVFNKRTKFNDFPNKQKVLFAGSIFEGDKILQGEEAYQQIKIAINAIGKGKIIFLRPHPSEDISLYQQFIKDMSNPDIILAQDYNLYDLIYNVDLIISYNSTILLESLYMQKKVLQIKLYDIKYEGMPVGDLGYAWQVKDTKELDKIIPKILDDKTEIKEKLKKFNADFPRQKAAPKIAQIIIDHLN